MAIIKIRTRIYVTVQRDTELRLGQSVLGKVERKADEKAECTCVHEHFEEAFRSRLPKNGCPVGRSEQLRIYLAVEGEGEQSFIRLLQNFADQNDLYVHLDCRVLGGGGYKTMLRQAVLHRQHTNKQKNKAKFSILLVDGDRSERKEDGWTLVKLKEEASKSDFQICVQHPNQEGLLFRMLPGNENKKPNVNDTYKLLVKQWPDYQKPVDFRMLSLKFNLQDLLRVAKRDMDLSSLLSILGLT